MDFQLNHTNKSKGKKHRGEESKVFGTSMVAGDNSSPKVRMKEAENMVSKCVKNRVQDEWKMVGGSLLASGGGSGLGLQ